MTYIQIKHLHKGISSKSGQNTMHKLKLNMSAGIFHIKSTAIHPYLDVKSPLESIDFALCSTNSQAIQNDMGQFA